MAAPPPPSVDPFNSPSGPGMGGHVGGYPHGPQPGSGGVKVNELYDQFTSNYYINI